MTNVWAAAGHKTFLITKHPSSSYPRIQGHWPLFQYAITFVPWKFIATSNCSIVCRFFHFKMKIATQPIYKPCKFKNKVQEEIDLNVFTYTCINRAQPFVIGGLPDVIIFVSIHLETAGSHPVQILILILRPPSLRTPFVARDLNIWPL